MPTDRDRTDTPPHQSDQPEPDRTTDRPTGEHTEREKINTQLDRLTGDTEPAAPEEQPDGRQPLDQDLFIAGNASGFKLREKDFRVHEIQDSTIVGPFAPQSPLDRVDGLSAYDSTDNLKDNTTGVVWRIDQGTLLPEGVDVHADGADVRQTYRQDHGIPDDPDEIDPPVGHRSIYPAAAFEFSDLKRELEGVDKSRVGKADKGTFRPIQEPDEADR